jgi:hypothetical protein
MKWMHTIFDKTGTAYTVTRKLLDGQTIVYTVHAGDHLELESSRRAQASPEFGLRRAGVAGVASTRPGDRTISAR